MEFAKVESSMISGVFYDDFASNLYVEFKNGSVYYYRDVPKFLYDEMLSAESVGKFFIANIKNAFTCAKLSEEP